MLKLKLPAFLKKPDFKNRKTFGLSFILIIILGFVGWAFFNDTFKDNRKVYAQAAGHKIYEDELRGFIGNNKNVSDHDAAKVLADKYLVEALAKEQEITVTDKDIMTEYGKGFKKQKTNNKYAYQNKINQIYFDKLSTYNEGIYKGKYIVANFSRYIPYKSPLLEQDKSANPKVGNSKAIAQDKKHAKNLLERLYNDISSGKITFEQAIETEKNDPVVGENVYPTLAHSGSFDTSIESTAGFLDINSLRRYGEEKIKEGQTTKPFVMRSSDSADGDSTVESYYMIVRLDKAVGGGAEMSAKQYIKQAKERLRYGVYV